MWPFRNDRTDEVDRAAREAQEASDRLKRALQCAREARFDGVLNGLVAHPEGPDDEA